MKNSQQTKNIGLAAIGLLIIGLSFFIKSQYKIEVDDSALPATTEIESTKPLAEENDEILELEMSSYKFNQDKLTVKAGQTVTIKLENVEGFHDFIIDELDVASEQIAVGQETTVTFTVPESAVGKTYEYYCSVGNHRELGMVGLLVIK